MGMSLKISVGQKQISLVHLVLVELSKIRIWNWLACCIRRKTGKQNKITVSGCFNKQVGGKINKLSRNCLMIQPSA